jgi:hypothetical protein
MARVIGPVVVIGLVPVIVMMLVPVIVLVLVPHSSRMTGKVHRSTSTPATATRLRTARS